MQKTIDDIIAAATQAKEEITKAETGNKAAGTRARHLLSRIRDLSQQCRKEILTAREGK